MGPPQEERPPSPEFAFSPPAPQPQRVPSPTLLAGPGSPLRASLNPSEARAIKAAARRRAAAEFVHAQTGIRLPADSDLAFRTALRDGVALCRLLNALRPGAVGKVRGWQMLALGSGMLGQGRSAGHDRRAAVLCACCSPCQLAPARLPPLTARRSSTTARPSAAALRAT